MDSAFFIWRNRLASAGTISVDFTAETARFTSELRKVNEHLKESESQFARFGEAAKVAFEVFAIAEVTAQITEGIAKSLELGEAIALASEKAGVAAGAFSQLTFAAKVSGVGIDDLSVAFKKMQVEIAGGGKVIESLGVNLNVLRSLTPDKQFELVAEAVSKIEDPAVRAAAAVAVFGKTGANLLPLLSEGAKGIEELRDKSIKIGAALSDSQVDKLSEAEKSVKKLEAAYEGFAASLTAKVAPAITGIFDKLTNIISGAKDDPVEALKVRIAELDTDIANRSRKQVGHAIVQGEDPNDPAQFLRSGVPANLAADLQRRAALIEKLDAVEAEQKKIEEAKADAIKAGVNPAARTFGDLQAAQTLAINKDLEQMAADSASALDKITEASNQKFFDGQAERTRVVQRETQRQSEAEQALADFQEQQAQDQKNRDLALFSARVDAVEGGLALIGAVTMKDAKLQKEIAIAASIINTIRGVTLQLTGGDVYTAVPRAIAVGLFGAAEVAKIVSTPVQGGNVASIGGGAGASIGTQPTSPFNQTASAPRTPQAQPAVTQIVINGDFIDTPGAGNKFIDIIREQLGQDVLMIPRNSAQAQMFMPAQ